MSNILIIEDDPLTLYGVVDLLEAENFQVTGVTNGDIALELIKQKSFDLIICDLLLSKVNGYEVLSALKKNTDTATIPFIILSAKNKRRDIRLGMDVGASDYITKPFLNHELVEAIQTQLNPRAFLEQCYETKNRDLKPEKNEGKQNLPHEDSCQNFLASREDITSVDTEYLVNKFENSFKQYVEKRLNFRSPRQKTTQSIAVCCISLDRIKDLDVPKAIHQPSPLNERENFAILKTVNERISSEIGSQAGITLLQARDYLVTLPYIKTLSETIELIKLVRASLSKPFYLGERTIQFIPCVGISFSADDNQEFALLFERAKQIVKYARLQGEDYYEVYQPNIKQFPEFKSLVLVDDLQNAIAKKQLKICYQPQVDIFTGEIVGCEALMRWHHPQKGDIPPAQFIALAEDIGLIESIEDWFLDAACQQLNTWDRAGFSKLRLALNFSYHQFDGHDFLAKLAKIIQQRQILPSSLAIELTEKTLLENSRKSLATLTNLKSLGIKVAIDNFGRGHHALTYLRNLPFDILKVDMCHLHNFFGEKNSQIALKYILKMTQRLKVELIVEKVETKKQLNFLRQNQFRRVQGYYLAHPLTANKFEQLLHKKIDWLSFIW